LLSFLTTLTSCYIIRYLSGQIKKNFSNSNTYYGANKAQEEEVAISITPYKVGFIRRIDMNIKQIKGTGKELKAFLETVATKQSFFK
jgi:hypothetical protein